jgi:type I restriction enzyme R subunit
VDKEFDGESVQIYEPGESDPVAPPDNALPTDEEGVPLPETPGADETLVDQPGLPLAPEGPQKKVYVDGVGARARLAAMA